MTAVLGILSIAVFFTVVLFFVLSPKKPRKLSVTVLIRIALSMLLVMGYLALGYVFFLTNFGLKMHSIWATLFSVILNGIFFIPFALGFGSNSLLAYLVLSAEIIALIYIVYLLLPKKWIVYLHKKVAAPKD